MDNYLKECKNHLHRLDDFEKVHVVLGNEACDLDSTVSSLAYGYLLHSLNPSSDTAVISVMNVLRQDIRLKTEVTFFLEENDILLNEVVVRDDIDMMSLLKQNKLLLTLVDHNVLAKSDMNFASSVVEIIDHHKKSRDYLYDEKCEMTIENVGSCCTLVAEKILSMNVSLLDKQLATLLCGTILFDTVCLDESAGRVTEKDKSIVARVKQYAHEFNSTELVESIQRARFDVSGLSLDDILRKDLKVVSNSSINIAVSSIPLFLTDMITNNNFEVQLKSFNASHNYHNLVVMGLRQDSVTKDTSRQICVYSINIICKQQIADYLAAVESLELSPVESTTQCLSIYDQGNVRASRKSVLPLLSKFLMGDETQEQQQRSMQQHLQENVSKDANGFVSQISEVNASSLPVNAPPNGIVASSSSTYLYGFGDPLSLPISSQNSSNQNSCPYTPQNSYVEGEFEEDPYAKQLLPSFNSREMMEKIETKREKLRGYEAELPVENYPFTPKNSFVDSNFASYMPSIDTDALYKKMCEKKDELDCAEENSNVKKGFAIEPCEVVFTVSSEEGTMLHHQDADTMNSPEDNSLASSQGEKGEEKMDISTSGSDKDAGSPAMISVVTQSQGKQTNGTENSNQTRTRFSSNSTSTLSMGPDVDSEFAVNYQAETVDFPDSPRQMKLMAQNSICTLKTNNTDDLIPDDDEVFRTVLSPGYEDISNKDRPTSLTNEQKKKISVSPDILNASEMDDFDDDGKSLSSLSDKSADLLSPVDDIATPIDIETPDDLDDSIFEKFRIGEPIPELSATEEYDEERSWRTCVIGGVQRKIDMKVIEPYKKVLSHGGYCPDSRNAIIVFSACYLPDRSRLDYEYVMDNLFLYVLTTLDQLVADDYVLLYLHGATERSNMPSFGWLKRCYQMIDRRLRKNLKGLYLVHPTFWLKTIVLMTKPFISSKFSRKLQFVASLRELAEVIPMDHVCIPAKVKQLEFQLMILEKKKRVLKSEHNDVDSKLDRARFGF